MKRDIQVFASRAELARGAAEFLTAQAGKAIRKRGTFTLALAGGQTPKDLYTLLAREPYRSEMDWEKVQLFWGDERCVPADHPDSNYRMVKESLLHAVPLPAENVNRIRGEVAPSIAAAEYADLLREKFAAEHPRFDMILLGVGADGHTASLFPGTSAVQEETRLAVEVFVPALNIWRVTLTLPVLNAAHEVVFLVAGKQKAPIVQRILTLDHPTRDLPASLVLPQHGAVHWLLDAEAAGALPHKKISNAKEKK